MKTLGLLLTWARLLITLKLLVAEQRKAKRFELRLPFELVRSGSERVSRTSQTKNLSSGGVLFTSEELMQVGEPIEYLITLYNGAQPVRLRCMGKVIRLEQPVTEAAECAVAATLERYEFVRHKSN